MLLTGVEEWAEGRGLLLGHSQDFEENAMAPEQEFVLCRAGCLRFVRVTTSTAGFDRAGSEDGGRAVMPASCWLWCRL